MPSSEYTTADVQKIRKQFAQFSRLEVPPILSVGEIAEIREALLFFNELSEYQTLGVCADNLSVAQTAIETYVNALSQPVKLQLEVHQGPVYIKFNTLNGNWYVEPYSGLSRGVLISFHVSDPHLEAINGTYGPFPLDLFE